MAYPLSSTQHRGTAVLPLLLIFAHALPLERDPDCDLACVDDMAHSGGGVETAQSPFVLLH